MAKERPRTTYREPAHDHRGGEPILSEDRRGNEEERKAVVPLAAAPGQVPEQYRSDSKGTIRRTLIDDRSVDHADATVCQSQAA
jgi:hypothetical protein